MPPPTDEILVRRVLDGDVESFAPLVDRYRRAALVCAIAVLGRRDDAEDVAQEAMVRAYTSLAMCRDHARFGAWLLTIVRRTALNHLRAARRRRAVPLEGAAEIAAPPRAEDTAETSDRRAIAAALHELSAIQRHVLLLSDLEGLPHHDIASLTGLSVLMSRRHLSNARRRVRLFLSRCNDT